MVLALLTTIDLVTVASSVMDCCVETPQARFVFTNTGFLMLLSTTDIRNWLTSINRLYTGMIVHYFQ